jgi:hypothetical protein
LAFQLSKVDESLGDSAGDSPSSLSRPNPKERRIISSHAPQGHRLVTAMVPVLAFVQSWLSSRWLQGEGSDRISRDAETQAPERKEERLGILH